MKILAYGPYPSQKPTAPTPAGSWLVPAPAQGFGSWSSNGAIHGQPGTEAIPAPAPAAVPQGWPRRLHASSDAPDIIFPGLYYQDLQTTNGPNLHNTSLVSYVSDNALPVPAIDPRGLPAVMSTPPPRVGGQGQVVSPYAVQNWPKWVTP
jgi:hypothetical protein